jgi:hypothetical protein
MIDEGQSVGMVPIYNQAKQAGRWKQQKAPKIITIIYSR